MSGSGRTSRRLAEDRLVRSVTSPTSSSAGAVLVVGTVGIGKTTFCEDLRASATAAGVLTGWGSAGAGFDQGPLGPWIDAINDLEVHRGEPGNDAGRNPAAFEPDQPSLTRYRAVARHLDELAAVQPVIVILEDFHDADSASLDLLGFLAQRTRRAPWLVIATTRPNFVRLAGWRNEVLRLEGLDADDLIDVTRSIGVVLTSAQAEELRRRTDGNPLLARRLVEHGVHDDDLTPSLSSLLRAEVAEIPPAIQPLVDAASVLGTRSDVALTTAILREAGTEPGPVLAATGAGIEGVVSVDHDTIRFSHPLMRELVYDGLDAQRRVALHAAASRVLQRTGADSLTIIRHVRRTPVTEHDGRVGELAADAADIALAGGALVEAVDHARFAQQVIDRHGSPDECADAALRLVRALSWAGRIADAEIALRQTRTLGDVISPEMRRRIVRAYARLRWREEPNPTVLSADSLQALAVAWLGASSDPADEAVLHTSLVGAGEITGLERGHLEVANRAVAAAERAGDPLLRSEAHLARRRAFIAHPSRLRERSADSRLALELAAQIGDDELIGRCQRHCVCDALAAGDRVAALSLIVRYDSAPTVGLREHTALREAGIATIEGRYDDAERVLENATEELASLGVQTPTLDYFRTFIAFDRGGVPELLAQFEHLIAAVADPALRSAFAWAAVVNGDRERANRLLDGLAADLDAVQQDHLWPVVVAVAGEAAAANGHACCADLLARLEPFEGQCLIPAAAAAPWFGAYDRIIGLLRYHLGDSEGAIDALGRSIAIAERMHAAPWQARGHLALATVLRSTGQKADADSHARAGKEIADDLGMGDVFLAPCPPVASALSSAVRPTTPTGRSIRFQRSGSGWRVGSGPDSIELPHLAGLEMLRVLVAAPSTDWHVLDLYGAANGVAGVQEQRSGPVLDDAARRSYQQRYAALSVERDSAEDDHDIGRVAAISEELDALEAELVQAFGLGGRARDLDDPSERARINVKRSIGRALAAIDGADPWVGDHLRHRVVTGRFCRYEPDPHDPPVWVTG